MPKFYRRLTLIAIYVIVLAPLIPQIIWSFTLRWYYPDLLPSVWSLRAWAYVFSPSSRVGEGFVNSLLIALIVSLAAILVGLPAARALALYEFRGKAWIEWLLMTPIIVPGIVAVMGIHIMFIRYRLHDSLLGVVLVHLIPCVPYMVLVMASVFANYGTELEETARTLGASPPCVFWHVTLPGIFPGLLVATMFTFLISWSQYITTVLIGGGQIITLPMVLFPFISGSNEANAAAISLIFVAPALLVLVLTARQLGREICRNGRLWTLVSSFDLAALRTQLASYQNNQALLLPDNLAQRTEAVELTALIEQIAPKQRAQLDWGELHKSAQILRQQCAAVDRQFFVELRHEILDRRISPAALRNVFNRFTAYQTEQRDFIHWRAEALDRLIEGILAISSPMPSQPLEKEMVHLEHTPASVVLEMVDRSQITPASIFYDLGSGLGQVPILVHLLTGAQTIGVEVEPSFCKVADACAVGLDLTAVKFVNRDVRSTDLRNGNNFFMFTPFRGTILQTVLEQLRRVAADHPITLCTYGPCTQAVAKQTWLRSIDDNADHEFKLAIFRS